MKIYQVDAFTSKRFSGNPAGVMIVDEFPSVEFMQNIASEMNLAETAFIKNISRDSYEIRFFTPESEVDICGHATLSSAHILFSRNIVSNDIEISFQAKGGSLKVKKDSTGYIMNFPLWGYSSREDIQKIQEITGVDGILGAYDTRESWIILEISSPKYLKEFYPTISKMKNTSYKMIIMTCEGDDKYDYYMRCFDADCGVEEDPVTGSIECALAPFWGERLGKTNMTSYQCSSRGGEKGVEVLGDRVIISGEAITVFEIDIL